MLKTRAAPFLDKIGYSKTQRVYQEKLNAWKTWQEVAVAAHS
ncbi:hypothetical protein HNQ91_002415 [Filimonas zeae]|nr:hypothetical protein [Filimonas zeae]MDR6339364.1 hypothetical protein [Filimonas zeae]